MGEMVSSLGFPFSKEVKWIACGQKNHVKLVITRENGA
jgi:hypothetical protein